MCKTLGGGGGGGASYKLKYNCTYIIWLIIEHFAHVHVVRDHATIVFQIRNYNNYYVVIAVHIQSYGEQDR